MRLEAIVLVLVSLLCGCSSKKAPSESKSVCQTQVDGLKQFLTTLEAPVIRGGGVTVPTRVDLPAQPLHPRPELTVSSNATSLSADGQVHMDDLVAPLTEARKTHDGLYVLVDKQATFDRVVAAVATAQQAGFTKIAFVFLGPPADKPPRSKADDRLDAILKNEDAAANMAAISTLIGEITSTCPSLKKLHEGVAEQLPDGRLKYMRDGTGPAVLACECKLDIPSLQSVMHRMLGMQTTLRIASVSLSDTGKPFAAPATATWEDVGKRLEAMMSDVKFAVD